jgi:hypothetical protein
VVVLDITGQYAEHFRDLFPDWCERRSIEAIATAIAPFRDRIHQNVHEGGNIPEFRAAVRGNLEDFLGSDYRIKIYNPGGFDVTRQDSKVYAGTAALAPLTGSKTARVFAEELLQVLSVEMLTKLASVSFSKRPTLLCLNGTRRPKTGIRGPQTGLRKLCFKAGSTGSA